MNGEKILLAIGDIRDQHIMEFADVKPCPKKEKSRFIWVRWASAVASIVLIISTVLLVNEYQHKDVAPAYNMIIVSDKMYEIIPFKDSKILQNTPYADILAEHGLSYPVQQNELGERLGTFKSENNEIYAVYDYKPYKGKSVLVVQNGSQLQYALFCNLDSNNTIPMDELLELYGFGDPKMVYGIYVDDTDISNIASVQVILNEMKQTSISVDYIDTDNTAKMKIVVKGADSDVLIFDYYPERNVLNKSLTFYQVSPTLAALFEK